MLTNTTKERINLVAILMAAYVSFATSYGRATLSDSNYAVRSDCPDSLESGTLEAENYSSEGYTIEGATEYGFPNNKFVKSDEVVSSTAGDRECKGVAFDSRNGGDLIMFGCYESDKLICTISFDRID